MSRRRMSSTKKQRYFNNLFKRQHGRCFWCEAEVVRSTDPSGHHHPTQATIDRLYPGSMGGKYNMKNIVLSCYKCNEERGDENPEQYAKKKNIIDVRFKMERIQSALPVREKLGQFCEGQARGWVLF